MFPSSITNKPLLNNDYDPEYFFGKSSPRGEHYPSYEFSDSDDSGSDEDLSFDHFKEPRCKKCKLKLPKDWYKNKKLWPLFAAGAGAICGALFTSGSYNLGSGVAAKSLASWFSTKIGIAVGAIGGGALAGSAIGLGILALGFIVHIIKKRCNPKEIFTFKRLPRSGRLSTISEHSSEDFSSTDESPFRSSLKNLHYDILKSDNTFRFSHRVSENYFSPTAVDL